MFAPGTHSRSSSPQIPNDEYAVTMVFQLTTSLTGIKSNTLLQLQHTSLVEYNIQDKHVETVSTLVDALLNLLADSGLGELTTSTQNRRVREPIDDDSQCQHLVVREDNIFSDA
jgi:hypothetical protein